MVQVLENTNIVKKLASSVKKRSTIPLLVVIFLVGGFLVTFRQLQIQQDIRQQAAPGDSLTVNTTNTIRPFTHLLLGQDLVNWEHSWGKPYPNEIPNLSSAMKEQGVGLIRYAGGLWANYVGFDRSVTQRTPYTDWTRSGNTYSFTYGTGELDSLNKLADNIGAEVMIQVNVSQNDPAMWADMVRYTNIEKGYNFKYWELGNEFDIDSQLNITPEIYAERIKAYIDAMKDVDPSIQIITGVPGAGHDGPRQGFNDSVTDMSHYVTLSAIATSPKGRKPDALSYHWYQACNSTSATDLLRYSYPGLATNSWRNIYSRIWSQISPSRMRNEVIGSSNQKLGMTELNFDACNYDNTLNGNHLNALWAVDVIGRLAYNGLDFITWYEGYANQGYSTIYADNGDNPTQIFTRPSYYAFYMYNKYFGDTLLESHSYSDADISIWASSDSKDSGKLKLMITNLTANDIIAPTTISGFAATSGSVYILKSTNPTDTSATSNTSSAPTTINGIKLNANNIVQSGASIQPVPLTVNGSSFTYVFPAYSTTAIVLSQAIGITPTATPLPTATSTPTATPTLTPIPTATPTIPTGGTQTIIFDDLGTNIHLNGIVAPVPVDWGNFLWHSKDPAPVNGQFPTEHLSFNSPDMTNASFSFTSPKILLSLDVNNRQTSGSSTVTITCSPNPTRTFTIPATTILTVTTGWTTPCTTVNIANSNTWNTRFDNLVYSTGGATGIPTQSPAPTATLTPSATPIPFRPGDINRDNKVDVQDLSYLLSNWGTNNALADLNRNGIVNTLDLSILLSNWQS